MDFRLPKFVTSSESLQANIIFILVIVCGIVGFKFENLENQFHKLLNEIRNSMNLSIQSLSFGVFAIFIGVSQVSSANDVCRTLQKNLFYTAIRNTNQLRSQIRYDKVLADAYEKSNNVVLKDHIQTVEAISLGMNAGIEADRQDLREYIKFATACFPNLTSEDISDLLKPLSE